MARVLLVSDGAVPTPEQPTVHGGGMRVWGLAQALRFHGHDVAVARAKEHTDGRQEHQGVTFATWSLNAAFLDLVHSHDAVIVSYALGSVADWLGRRVSDETLLILDAYVPIHIEVAARSGRKPAADYANFGRLAATWRNNLAFGDAILCASRSQHAYYTGILSSLGTINPWNYPSDLILVVPFGAEVASASRNPYADLEFSDDSFVLVWFGAVYPWLDISPVLEAVERLAPEHPRLRLVVIGARNPLVSDSAFDRSAADTERRMSAAATPVLSIPWVAYGDRLSYLTHADAVISLNTAGRENAFAWRTRLMDSVSAGTPLLTNGGDPLAELLIEGGGAVRVPDDPHLLAAALESVIDDQDGLASRRTHMERLRTELQWEVLVEPLHQLLISGRHPRREERAFARAHHVPYRRDPRFALPRVRMAAQAKASGGQRLAKAALRRLRPPGG